MIYFSIAWITLDHTSLCSAIRLTTLITFLSRSTEIQGPVFRIVWVSPFLPFYSHDYPCSCYWWRKPEYSSKLSPLPKSMATSSIQPRARPRIINLRLCYKVCASRAYGCLFGHPNPQKSSLRTPNFYVGNFLKCQSQAYLIKFFHQSIVPMTLYTDIMPYFDKLIHVYG